MRNGARDNKNQAAKEEGAGVKSSLTAAPSQTIGDEKAAGITNRE
jgi:hypothetical protein